MKNIIFKATTLKRVICFHSRETNEQKVLDLKILSDKIASSKYQKGLLILLMKNPIVKSITLNHSTLKNGNFLNIIQSL